MTSLEDIFKFKRVEKPDDKVDFLCRIYHNIDLKENMLLNYQSWVKNDVKAGVEKDLKEWQYKGSLFREARKNVRCAPSLMPILAAATFKHNVYIPYASVVNFACKVCQVDNYDDEDVEQHIIARAYQIHTGYLRELDCCLKIKELYPALKIVKNAFYDLERGVDLFVTGNKICMPIGIQHAGSGSDNFYNIRKRFKEFKNIVYLKAQKDSGLSQQTQVDVISCEDIKRQLACMV